MTLAYWALAALDDGSTTPGLPGRVGDTAQQGSSAQDHDAGLVERIRLGDVAAFEALYRATWPGLIGFATSLIGDSEVAAEAVGDVFAAVWQRRDVWQPITAQSYLFGAVRNRVLNYRRSASRASAAFRRARPEDFAQRGEVDPDAQLLASERYRVVQEALQELSEPQRTLLLLRWQRQMPWDEIARILGISSTAVQQQHSRLLKRLRVAVEAALG